jgi:hypothetical protein
LHEKVALYIRNEVLKKALSLRSDDAFILIRGLLSQVKNYDSALSKLGTDNSGFYGKMIDLLLEKKPDSEVIYIIEALLKEADNYIRIKTCKVFYKALKKNNRYRCPAKSFGNIKNFSR